MINTEQQSAYSALAIFSKDRGFRNCPKDRIVANVLPAMGVIQAKVLLPAELMVKKSDN